MDTLVKQYRWFELSPEFCTAKMEYEKQLIENNQWVAGSFMFVM
jgi:hypothetical protein